MRSPVAHPAVDGNLQPLHLPLAPPTSKRRRPAGDVDDDAVEQVLDEDQADGSHVIVIDLA